jgi:enoyl-[acyl-carrier protein] reductase/trans-2-enoyl-CoA reductase (NAD+)
MIIEPKIKSNICLTSHPLGCRQNVQQQINYVLQKGPITGGKKRVLVLGCSAGFGLSSRIASAFGSSASTIGVMFERPAENGRTASAGWYNTVAFEQIAAEHGLYAKTVQGDAFTDAVKQEVCDLIQNDLGQIDLVIYSLAAPRRTHPRTGVTHRSVLRPIGETFESKTVDWQTDRITSVTITPANEEEINDTVQVMGGEDWKFWMNMLLAKGLLAEGAMTVAYSYVGPAMTERIYRRGTIGQAKDHLERTAFEIQDMLKPLHGSAYVSVNKALVTQASSVIPVIPLYISMLYKVMKEKNIHEGCMEQMDRLYRERLFTGKSIPLDSQGRIRIDDWEMRADVQQEIVELWKEVGNKPVTELGDLEGCRNDYLNLYGFGAQGVDYTQDVDEKLDVPSIMTAK